MEEDAAIKFMIEEWGDPGPIPQIPPVSRGKVDSSLAQTVVALNKRTKPFTNKKHCFLLTLQRGYPKTWLEYRETPYKKMKTMNDPVISKILQEATERYEEAWKLRYTLDEIDQETLFGPSKVPIIGGALDQKIEDRENHQDEGQNVQ